ncbi:toxin glutamine deamidase domain-containing protein [Mycolicibacterium sp. XJ870]
MADDPAARHSVHGRNRWNPDFLRSTNCAYTVAEELSVRYGRDFNVDAPISPRGVPARSLFEAVGSAARFGSYSEVEATLQRLGPGSSAVLASRWSGRGQGGHAYLAVNDSGTIYLLDPHSGQRSGWPPHWGRDAVKRTAVGYLDADGVAVNPLDGNTDRQLLDADAVGHVQGDRTDNADHAIAEEALAQRTPAVRPDELRNPLGVPEEAAARARNNAVWWAGLSETQQQALIGTYPQHIGNAEGIPAAARDAANRNVLQELRDRADLIQTKIDEFERPSRAERKFLAKINQLDRALDKARADAARAGEDGPLLLAFDPQEFGGDGRVLLSFGHDPYSADSVSWHVPGVQTTMHSLLGFYSHSALNHLQSVRAENAELKATSIAWVGYDAPSGRKFWRAAGHGYARTGGDMLYSDITAFNAVHESTSGTVVFNGNHIFGYSYGSTTTGYAGRDGRLGDHVSTVTLVGSPGAGPITHASAFGIGADNVFAASSSRDVVTALGGRTPESSGRILGIGLGIDPAMHSFGAVRVTAEFPSGLNHLLTGGTHHAYFLHTPSSGRSESLVNLGRIASGHSGRVAVEPHRTVDGRHTVEPAAGSSARRIWNLPWRSGQNCALGVAQELSAMYGREVQLATQPTRSGVPARVLFEAVGTDATFATYAEVEQRLRELGDGSSAVLASRWSGGRGGGHAYLAVNVGGEIHLVDSHRGRSGWPPHWGQDAVSRTAVGYLDPTGKPVGRSTVDAALSLAAADDIGHVRGHRDEPDFGRRQAEYRAQNPATRPVDSRYAQSLDEVVGSLDPAAVHQLAEDLSGTYGPHRIQLEGEIVGREVMLTGTIFHGNRKIGTIQRTFQREADGNLVAYHNGLVIEEEFEYLRGKGFSKAVTAELERYYVDSGVDHIELKSHDTGSNAWARRGFTWDPKPHRLAESLGSIKSAATRLAPNLSPEGRAVLADMVARLEPGHPRLPEPIEVATLATAAEPGLGTKLLHRTEVSFVRHLPVAEERVQPNTGLMSRLQRWLGLGGQQSSAQNCAHGVAAELTQRYERPFRVDVRASRTGVPAWALFRAVGSTAQFATNDDVAATLHDLGDGSSAVLASRWAGSQGGHAYLAVNDGGQIYLVDPHTGKRSGWPPHWGQQAVDRTAVGYLDTDGTAVRPLQQAPLHVSLSVADGIGDVRGHGAASDFPGRQQEYRAQDPLTRQVDTRYTEPLGEVVDNREPAQTRRLAEDLSGVYGPYRVEFQAFEHPRGVVLNGSIFAGDVEIGSVERMFSRDVSGNLVAHHTGVVIDQPQFRGKGFSTALSSELERFYTRAGIDRIELEAQHDGAHVWARRGFTWDPQPQKLQGSLDDIKASARELAPGLDEHSRAVLDEMVQRLDPERSDLPEPVEIASLSTPEVTNLGQQLLEGSTWQAVRYLDGSDPHAAGQNCAHDVAGELSSRYGREYRVAVAPSRTGVPAWSLYQAVGSRAQFATYDDVAATLRQMPDGSSAVLTSRWAGGRHGGHAYLAVKDGGRIFLVDPHTRQRSGWPPHWGRHAVDRTAVGYLDANGDPVEPLHRTSSQQAFGAADTIGDVRGTVDTRYAEPLGEVINESGDQARAQRLADDLSGVYGPYRVQFSAEALPSAVQLRGEIFNGDKRIGEIDRIFIRDDTGTLVAHHNEMKIEDEAFRGKGFSKAFLSEFDRYYVRSGVDRIELLAAWDGAYASARRGFTWDLRTHELQESLDSVKIGARRLLGSVSTEAREVLEQVIPRLEPGHPQLPEPSDVANLTAPGHPELGREILRRATWHAVKYVDKTPGHRSPDDVELAGFWDRIGQLDQDALSPEALADAVYRSVPIDTVTGFYEGRVSGFKSAEVLRAQRHVEDTLDNAFFVSADIANLRGLNQAAANRTEANAHFSGLSAVFHAALAESGADVVPMRIGGDELGAVVVGDIDESTIESAIATIRARAQQYAQEHGLADIPHPKHPGQPEYNGVGLHVGYAGVQPDLDVRDIFDDADLGVDRSKTRRSHVAGGPGRATGIDRADTAGEATPGRGDGTRTGSQAAGSESQVASRAGTEGQAGQRLNGRTAYQQPEDLKRATFLADAARLGAEGRSALQALYEPQGRDEVSGFYDGRASEFKTGEVSRARRWITESGEAGILVSAQLDNLSGLNAYVQNRAEVANAHYRAITQIFRAEIEATGATIVPMRTSGDRFDAVVIGAVDSTAVDAALDRIGSRTAAYAQNEGLTDIANPSNADRPGVRLFFGYSDLTSHGTVDEVIEAAERQMFGRQDSGDPRRVSQPEVDIPNPRQPYNAADFVGDVQGHPDDSEFLARQQEYRDQDPAGRPADSRYAEPVGDVVDNASDPQRVHQLAEDLSGVYGPFRIELQRVPDEAAGIAGYILSGGKRVGNIYWSYRRDAEGNLVAFHGMIQITSASNRGKGFSKALAKQLEPFYAHSGVDRIEMEAAWDGAYAWASWGFNWAPELAKLQESLNSIKSSAQRLRPQVGPEAQAVLDEVVQRLDPDHPRLPEPIDLARLTAPGHPDLGQRLLTNTNWHAVRYLDPNAGDVIGDVRGYPEDGEYLARQQDYRNQDPAIRQADTSFADHMAEAIDSYDRQDARQLAEDLSGRYGPYHVDFSVERSIGGESVSLYGQIRSGESGIGYVSRKFSRDDDGNLVVHNTIIKIEIAEYRGQDFSKALTSELERYYARCGVDRIELVSKWQGSNAWARRGFTWTTDQYHLNESLNHIKEAARQLRGRVGTESQALLDQTVERLEVGHPRLPEPIDLANLATSEEPQLGRKLLDNTSVHFVKYLPSLPSADLQAPDQNCAHGVADALSERYGREFRVAAEPSRTGVPARALYEAVGSASRFATYDQVEASLRQLGDGSSAVLTSRWRGGRSGGHAYLAVNDGGQIYLLDPSTGERTGWPPHWGQLAVDRTAVGYLDANGDAVNPLHDVPLRLGTAESVGDVQGLPAEPPSPQQIAGEALAQRNPAVDATELVRPTGDVRLAVERAQANAVWWQGLSEDQQQALIEAYPVQIGNAEGIPPMAAHEANSRAMQDWLAKGREMQSRLDSGIRLGWEKHLEMLRAKAVGDALQRAIDAARRAGIDGPYLLRFDPDAHGGAGVAVVGFGVDPYLAESVSWHVPGRGMTIQELGPGMGSALNHAMSVLLENPTASVASMSWIGYDTMADDAAQVGGDSLRSDISGFNAGRDAWTSGERFIDNHVFGHCQGSTVAGHAGEAGRLSGQVRTVTLFGSPGLGPMDHAGEFGPGIDVYVASSSTDTFTWHGGTTPGARGDFLGGFGVDPAMDFFAAQRITAEFPPVEMTRAGDYDIHNFYYKFVDKDAGVRNESLANFGRIAVGHVERVGIEEHRTVVSGPDQETKVRDPAASRSVLLDDLGVPDADPAGNCAYGVADAVSQRYGRDIRIETAVTATGVPARSLFQAVGSQADFATYTEVSERLAQLGPGSSAVLTSRWTGVRQGGHAYLAVNDGGEIYLIDQRTGQRSGWPPHWGQGAVDRTAVGYLDENGNAVAPLDDPSSQLVAPHAVGDVRGLPADPEFLRKQQEYRDDRSKTREVDSRYADPLAELVDNPDPQRGQQFADDLSGVYGTYRVELEAEAVPGSDMVAMSGLIFDGDTEIGSLDWSFNRDDDGKLVAYNGLVSLSHGYRGRGFSKAMLGQFEPYFIRSGVDRIELTSDWQGSNAWARRGFTWGPDLYHLQGALDQIKMRAQDLRDRVSAEGEVELDEMVERLEIGHPRFPEPIDLAILATEEEPDLGQRLLDNTSIDFVKYLPSDPLAALALPHHVPGSLPEGEAITAFTDGELRLRALNEELVRNGVTAEDRARQLTETRNALRSWAYGLMTNRVAADWLSATTANPTFEELVARNEERGLTGDAVYDAIVETATHSRLAPGSLSDIETGAVYSQFELGMRALDEQMIRDGASAEDRARTLSGLRSSLRAWTRELMENRPAAEWLAANESAPAFEDLVARYEAKGLTGDDVYRAIIDGATHSHYAAGTLSDEETRTVYTTFELRMRELREQLLRDGVGAEERARTLYGMRNTIRSWTRSLMEDRRLAEWLNDNEPNLTFDELVARNRAKGLVGDEIYEAIVASSTRSRGSVNADLGIDPDNPPDLPPMRGPTEEPT